MANKTKKQLPPWPMLPDAQALATALEPIHSAAEPIELLRINGETTAIITNIGGTDYVLTMTATPKQRKRAVQ